MFLRVQRVTQEVLPEGKKVPPGYLQVPVGLFIFTLCRFSLITLSSAISLHLKCFIIVVVIIIIIIIVIIHYAKYVYQ